MKKLTLFSIITLTSFLVFNSQAEAKFEHGISFMVDGVYYYFDGPDDGPNGEKDIPGHYWSQASPTQFVGKHYNTGPFGAASWWATGEDDGELLYIVHAIIDEWTEELAQYYASMGYIHYHEMVSVDNATPHPSKVIWLKHIARKEFYLDGGPAPEFSHQVYPGIDLEFIPIWANPYPGETAGNETPTALAPKPVTFKVQGAYPNPFNPTTTISYSIPEAGNVNMTVYDLKGRQIADLVNGYRVEGAHQVSFNASGLASGVYLYQLESNGQVAIGKMMLLK